MAIQNNFPNLTPTLLLDFANAGKLDPRVTFSRSTTATYFNSLGVLTTANNNVARFDYDPSTLAAQGLLIEEQRTNSIRNNTMVGAVAGTPGTAPTNWLISTATGNLTSREIVGIGTENGIAYIDVRFVASGAFNATIYADSSTGVPAANGQTWTASFFVKLAGGSLNNVTVQTSIIENGSGGNFLAGADSATFVPTSAALSTQRVTQTRTNTNASTAFEWARVRVNFAAAADITLRIGLPQLELGAFATSVIPTTTTALTRNADAASMTGTNFSSWYNAVEGTLFSESINLPGQSAVTFPRIANINDGSVNNVIGTIWRSDTSRLYGVVTTSGSVVADVGANGVTQTNINKIALGYATNNFAASVNGAAASTDTSGNVPTGLTTLGIGRQAAAADFLNGTIRRIAYYPVRVTNAQLQALTG
jgi:hypothetical protein